MSGLIMSLGLDLEVEAPEKSFGPSRANVERFSIQKSQFVYLNFRPRMFVYRFNFMMRAAKLNFTKRTRE